MSYIRPREKAGLRSTPLYLFPPTPSVRYHLSPSTADQPVLRIQPRYETGLRRVLLHAPREPRPGSSRSCPGAAPFCLRAPLMF